MEQDNSSEDLTISQRAEELLKNKNSGSRLELSESEMLKIIHELEQHKIELEMQNEELKLAREKAELATKKYSKLYDSAPSGYFTLSKEGYIIGINLCGSQMLYKERSLLINSRFGEFVSDDTKPVFNFFLKKLFSGKANEICEVCLSADENFPMDVQLSGIVDENGERCLVTVIDITERKQSEIAIRESEARLKRAEFASKSGNWEFHLDSRTYIASDGAANIYGLDGGGRFDYNTIKNARLPEYTPFIDNALQNLIERGEPFNLDYKIKNAETGKIVDIHSIAEYDKNKRIIFGILQDITDRKQMEEALKESEERFKNMVKDMRVGVMLQDQQAVITLSNPEALELLGLTEDQLLGKTSFDPDWNVIHEDGSPFPGHTHPVPRAIETRQPVSGVMGVYNPGKKDRVWILVDAVPQLNEDGTVNQVVCSFVNITDRKKIEETQLFLINNDHLNGKENFFNSLARYLAETLEMDYVCIDKLRGDLLSAQTVAIYFDGKFEDNVEYTLKDTPCGDVVGKAICCFPNGVRHLFPKDTVLEEMLAESYIGTTLLNNTGQPIGLIAVIGREPLQNRLLAESILKLVAIRTASEMDRQEAEEALIQSEKRYRSLFENMLNGFAYCQMIFDGKEPIDFIYLEVNNAFEYLTGLKNVKGRKVSEVIPGILESDSQLIKMYGKTAITGEPQVFETYLESLNIWFSISVYSPGKGYFVSVFEVITQRKQAEAALIESESKFRNLVKDMHVGVLIQDQQAKILLSNQAALELLGLTEDQLLGKTSFDPDWNVIHEDGSPFPGHTHPVPRAIETCKSVRGVIMGVYHPIEKDRVWLLVDAELQLNDDGAVKEVVCSFINITKRKQAEEALRETNAYLENLINYANAPIIVWDPRFRITRFNHAFEFLTGRAEAEVIGKSLDILFPPALVKQYMELIRKASTGERWETVEIDIMNINGSVRTILWNSATLFALNGKIPIATIAQGHDITNRLLVAAELKKSNFELQKVISEKDKFFSIIAHDLRSPFQGLLGLTEIMDSNSRQMSLEDISMFSGALRQSVVNLYKLLENLLEWAQFQKGSIPFTPKELSLSQVFSQSVESIQHRALQKEITIICEIPDHLKIYADEKMTAAVLRNLLSNAVKFTMRNGKVTGKAKAREDGMIEISVTDTGVGITEDVIDNLFKLDVQVSTRGTENEPSTGLGLILCKEFVEKNGGKIWAESIEDVGSTFCFTVPERS